jgi:hypothetical protein
MDAPTAAAAANAPPLNAAEAARTKASIVCPVLSAVTERWRALSTSLSVIAASVVVRITLRAAAPAPAKETPATPTVAAIAAPATSALIVAFASASTVMSPGVRCDAAVARPGDGRPDLAGDLVAGHRGGEGSAHPADPEREPDRRGAGQRVDGRGVAGGDGDARRADARRERAIDAGLDARGDAVDRACAGAGDGHAGGRRRPLRRRRPRRRSRRSSGC